MRRGDVARELAGSWDWLHFASQLPANPQFVNGASANQLVYSGRCILLGASLLNTASTAGSFQLVDGQDATGGVVAAVAAAASTPAGPTLPGSGVLCEIGVYLVVATAVLEGSVWVVPLWHDRQTPPGD